MKVSRGWGLGVQPEADGGDGQKIGWESLVEGLMSEVACDQNGVDEKWVCLWSLSGCEGRPGTVCYGGWIVCVCLCVVGRDMSHASLEGGGGFFYADILIFLRIKK